MYLSAHSRKTSRPAANEKPLGRPVPSLRRWYKRLRRSPKSFRRGEKSWRR